MINTVSALEMIVQPTSMDCDIVMLLTSICGRVLKVKTNKTLRGFAAIMDTGFASIWKQLY